MTPLTVHLSDELKKHATRLAAQRDITVGQLLRDALAAELKRASRNAKTPNRADEQLLAPIRALLASDFGAARSWRDLMTGLNNKGYTLREAGGGLALHSHPGGIRLCKASELGHGYAALMRRFSAPFPGHAHRHLADRILGPAQPHRHAPDDFNVIERF